MLASLPVKAKADFKVLLLTYKILHGVAPTYVSDLVIPTCMLQSQDAGLLTVPRISKQTAGGRAFSYRVPFLWNGLPIHVRDADSVSTFVIFLSGFVPPRVRTVGEIFVGYTRPCLRVVGWWLKISL